MKKKLGPDLSLYAYNSEFINKPKINKNGGFNFASLTKGFYDDIISTQKSIRTSQSDLNNLKTSSVKESVYLNRKVPSTWKTKLNYRKDVCKAIQTDNDFAIYLGKKEEIDPMEAKLNHFLGKDELNTMNETGFNLPKINRKIKTISPTARRGTIRHTQNFTSYLNSQFKDPNYLSEKEIASKLDEYKSKYDMEEYMANLRTKKIEETRNKFLITETDEEHKQVPFSPYHTISVPIEANSTKKHQISKPKVFKSSIYINLLPKDKEGEEAPQNDKRSKTKTFTNFLNVDTDEPIVITNPKKKRELEIINYYGPRYNYCSICQRKNLEFYQNFETKQCFKLLHYLKNERLPKRNIPTSQPTTARTNEETN